MISLFLICKNDLYFQAIRPILDEYEILIAGVCNRPGNAIETFIRTKADMIVLDANWPPGDTTAIEVLQNVMAYDQSIKVILMTTFFEDRLLQQIKPLGAKGYFYRNVTTFKNIISCITNVFKGRKFFAKK